MSQLEGKTAVIMGASGEANFGSAIARRLAEAGANVVVASRRLEPLQALAADINGLAVACDITDESQLESLFATLLTFFVVPATYVALDRFRRPLRVSSAETVPVAGGR